MGVFIDVPDQLIPDFMTREAILGDEIARYSPQQER
jgi:hypothetical protein